MNKLRTIKVGICSNGPVLLSKAIKKEYKFVISICNFDKFKDVCLICCKTTSKTEKTWPGEFILDDLFGRGKTKVQPYNICRVTAGELQMFKYIGILDDEHMPKFETGLKIAIKKEILTPLESLNVMDSWEPFFA